MTFRNRPLLTAVVAVCTVALGGCATSGGNLPTPSSATQESWPAAEFIDKDALLVLQWGDDGADTIFTSRADGAARAAMPGLPTDAEHPDVSPDGAQVAFRATPNAADQIWVAGLDGTAATVLVPCEQAECFGVDFPAWSPDGRSIAFTQYAEPLSSTLPPSGSMISIVDVTSGEVRSVASSGPGEVFDNARWSPDGSELVFQIDQFDAAGREVALTVAVVPSSGGDVLRLTDGALFGGYPDWDSVDDRIVFATYDLGAYPDLPEGAASNLYTVRPDGSQLTQLTTLPVAGARVTQPSWLRDGSGVLVTYVSEDGSRVPALVPGAGGAPILLGGDGATHVRQVPAP